jgi:hypothetical protein
VDRHDSHIWANSEPGLGLDLIFNLPALETRLHDDQTTACGYEKFLNTCPLPRIFTN